MPKTYRSMDWLICKGGDTQNPILKITEFSGAWWRGSRAHANLDTTRQLAIMHRMAGFMCLHLYTFEHHEKILTVLPIKQ